MIYEYNKENELVASYRTAKDAANKTGLSMSTIYNCIGHKPIKSGTYFTYNKIDR